MTTYLDLVNSTRRECGIITGDLTTLTGLVGKNLQVKVWVDRSWQDVQRKHPNWQWMRKSFSFATVQGQQEYTPAQAGTTNYGKWATRDNTGKGTFRTRVTSLGYTTELWLGEWDWEDFRNLYQFGAQRTVQGRPVVFSIKPDKSIALGPLPNAQGFTVTGDYFTRAVPLVSDTDVPGLPDQFTDVIIHRAKMMYGQEEAAAEVYNAGKADYRRMIADLEADQLPSIEFGGALL